MRRVQNNSNSTYPTDGIVEAPNPNVSVNSSVRAAGSSSNAHRGEVTDTAHSTYSEPNDLIAYIKSSRAYQQAYELMRNYPEWLTRLESIVNTAQVTSPAAFEGFTHKAQNSNQATLSNVFASIANLVAEFNQWQNSLPSEQVQQQIEAGLNPAMMNQSASEQSPNATPGAATHAPSAGDAVGPILSGIASFISSASNGLFSLVGTVSNTFSQHLKNEIDSVNTVIGIANSGYDIPDFDNIPIVKKYAGGIVNSPKYKSMSNIQKAEYVKSQINFDFLNQMNSKLNPDGLSRPLGDIAGLMVDSMRSDYEYKVAEANAKIEQAKFQQDYYSAADGTQAGFGTNAESSAAISEGAARIAESDYKIRYFQNKEKLEKRFFDDILSGWLEQSQKGDFWSQFMIFSLYNQFGPREYTGAISDLVGAGTDIVDTLNPISGAIKTFKNLANKGKGKAKK